MPIFYTRKGDDGRSRIGRKKIYKRDGKLEIKKSAIRNTDRMSTESAIADSVDTLFFLLIPIS